MMARASTKRAKVSSIVTLKFELVAEEIQLDPETWLTEHGDYLYRYAYTRLREHSTAEDMVQETFLAAYKSKHRFSGTGSVRAWLMGILKHKVVDYIRKAVRETHLENADDLDSEDTLLYRVWGLPKDRPGRWQFNPRKNYEQKEFWEVLQGCLGKLNARLHDIFVLRELEGVSTDEICKQFGITANNLWVLIHRARAQLKGCLETNWLSKHQETS